MKTEEHNEVLDFLVLAVLSDMGEDDILRECRGLHAEFRTDMGEGEGVDFDVMSLAVWRCRERYLQRLPISRVSILIRGWVTAPLLTEMFLRFHGTKITN